MKEAAFFLVTGLLSPLLNEPIIIVLVSLAIAVMLLVGVMVLLCYTRKFTLAQKVLLIQLCLLVVVIIFTALGFAGYSFLVSQRGIMLAAPNVPSALALTHVNEQPHLYTREFKS